MSSTIRGRGEKFFVTFFAFYGESKWMLSTGQNEQARSEVPEEPIVVSLIEDFAPLREYLTELLGRTPGFCLRGVWDRAEEALEPLSGIKPDVVLIDIRLPGMSGIECVRLLKRRLPLTQFMMLTLFEEQDLVFESILAGATGYLVKRTPPDRLLEGIKELHHGGSPMSSSIARKIIEAFQARGKLQQAKRRLKTDLTEREEEILVRLSEGGTYKAIASQLKLSAHTVRNHLQRIYRKLQVRTRKEAVARARRNGAQTF